MMQMLPDLKRCIWRWDLRISVVESMDWQRSYAFSLSLILTTKIHCFFSVEEDVTGSKPVSYTHLDAADEGLGVDLGGRRIIKKKKKK